MPVRTDSYEKIEMTARVNHKTGIDYDGVALNTPSVKPDLGGGKTPSLMPCAGHGLHSEENGYLCAISPSVSKSYDEVSDQSHSLQSNQCTNLNLKRNGDYLNIPTHCDDEEDDIAYINSIIKQPTDDSALPMVSGPKSKVTITEESINAYMVGGCETPINSIASAATTVNSIANCLMSNEVTDTWQTDSYRHLNTPCNLAASKEQRSTKMSTVEREMATTGQDLSISHLTDNV